MPQQNVHDDVSTRLSFFRPSDRAAISLHLADPATRDHAVGALMAYVVGWEKADWLDENDVTRIATWIAKTQDEALFDKLKEWATRRRTEAATVFLEGLAIPRLKM